MKWLDNTALVIVIIGAVNWLLVGIFQFDLVAFLFGNLSWLSRIIYTLVGLCGLYLISFLAESGIQQVMCKFHPLTTLYKSGSSMRTAVSSLYFPLIPELINLVILS